MSGTEHAAGPSGARPAPDGRTLGDAVLAREPGALARAVAMAGSADAAERRTAHDAVEAWARRTGKSVRLGLDGAAAPAIGALAARLAGSGHRVAVLDAGTTTPEEGPPIPSPGNPFVAAIPSDGLGVADAIRACEIGGYDTVLVAVGTAWSMSSGAVIDCRVGSDPEADVTLAPASIRADGALDALWRDVRRWHWNAIEDGTFAARRERQRRFRQGR